MIAAGGIDSWSPCWYLDRESPAAALLDGLATVQAARGKLLPSPVAGHRVGWFRDQGLLYAEGHPLGDLQHVDRLAPPHALPGALRSLCEALDHAGVPVPPGVARHWDVDQDQSAFIVDHEFEAGFAGLRRVDATVDLGVSSRSEGLAILAGVAAVATAAPRSQTEVRYAKDGTGSVETVYLRGYSGVKVLGRWYDKGLESGFASRGTMIRAEDQRRFPKGHRRWPGEMTSEYVRSKFQQRFFTLWQATKGVTVAGHVVLAEKLAQFVEAGEITSRQAEGLAGYLVLSKHGVRMSRASSYRRRSVLRDLGLVVADGALEEVEVDLHQVLDRALDGTAWQG